MLNKVIISFMMYLSIQNVFALPVINNRNQTSNGINTIDDILKQIPNDFLSSDFVNNDYVYLNKSDLFNSGVLKIFLTLKILQKLDIINLYSRFFNDDNITEFSNMTIYDQNKNFNENGQVNDCNKNTILNAISKRKKLSICPWHWIDIRRDDRFPYLRSFAECDCSNCMASTTYDTQHRRLSKCRPFYIHMPVLVKEYVDNETEKWNFGLEKVSNSCLCSIQVRIN